jgi:hypothetical protein
VCYDKRRRIIGFVMADHSRSARVWHHQFQSWTVRFPYQGVRFFRSSAREYSQSPESEPSSRSLDVREEGAETMAGVAGVLVVPRIRFDLASRVRARKFWWKTWDRGCHISEKSDWFKPS